MRFWLSRPRLSGVARFGGYLLCVASAVALLYDWDPTRIFYKRLKADHIYVYDELRPQHRNADARDYISIGTRPDADRQRQQLRDLVWGPDLDPDTLRPYSVRLDVLSQSPDTGDCNDLQTQPRVPSETLLVLKCQHDLYRSMDGLDRLDELLIRVGPDLKVSVAYLVPDSPNGVLIVYQNGYASTYHHQHRHLERLVDAGYTVAALNHIGYGDTSLQCRPGGPAAGWCDVGWGQSEHPFPLRAHFSPIVGAIGHAIDSGSIEHVAMLGFSAGGWLTVVAAALDARIDFSYAVAGFMPRYLQEHGENPPNQSYKPYRDQGSLIDQFILGADRPGRRQLQIFNQYDRCCYRNRRGLLYRDAVADAVESLGGQFDVLIDDTHPRHKISPWALDAIMLDLKMSIDQ